MLDAYIIDRIRREREQAQQIDRRTPLHIETPRGQEAERQKEPADDRPEERGSVVIDYSL